MALADVLKKIFGSKSDRDMKMIRPTLDKILAVYPEIDALSHDELRARTDALKERIAEVEAPFEQRISEIKATLEQKGMRLPDADIIVASIAIDEGLALVTGNVRHYSRIEGLVIENWFERIEN